MFFSKDDRDKPWRDGVFLCTANNSLEASILESKLTGEGIPSERRYRNAGNYLEIFMGASSYPIDIYVPEQALEDAKNIILAFPLNGEPVNFDELTDEEIDRLVGIGEFSDVDEDKYGDEDDENERFDKDIGDENVRSEEDVDD